MRILVVGGFERSGHDAVAEAVVSACQGHEVELFQWRDLLPLENHPVFHVHRIGARSSVGVIAGILDSDMIAERLACDLGHLVPTHFDVVVSVHPWSTIIAASALAHGRSQSRLVDVTPEFSPFPVVENERVDIYAGGGPLRSTCQAVRARCHRIGVPVRPTFVLPAERVPRLVVSGGSDGFAFSSIRRFVEPVMAALHPSEVVVLVPDSDGRVAWQESILSCDLPTKVSYVVGMTDIGEVLRGASWYLTKASGPAVAEALACGVVPISPPSGVFWEDESRAYLSAERAIVPVAGDVSTEEVLAGVVAATGVNKLGAVVRHAAEALVELCEEMHHGPPVGDPMEDEVLGRIRAQLADADVLPATSRKLAELIDEWCHS